MTCIYGSPTTGQPYPVQLPVKLSKGTVVREETVFHKQLSSESQEKLCEFIGSNLGVIKGGDRLIYASSNAVKLIVEVELLHDQLYTAFHRANGDLKVFVVV